MTYLSLSALALLAISAPSLVSAQIGLRVVADPPGPDKDNLNGEVVTITNRMTVPLDLSGWTLCNAILDCYTLPDSVAIGPSSSLRVHSGSGRDTLLSLYMNRDQPLWSNWADMATLRDGEGVRRARCLWDRGRGLTC